MTTKKQWLKQFFTTRRLLGRVELLLLLASKTIYTDRFAEKVAVKKNWREQMLNDLIAFNLIAYHESRRERPPIPQGNHD